MKKLNQYWRVFATGFCFATFGIGGLILGLVIIPLIHLFIREQTAREYKVQHTIKFTFTLFCKLMKYTGAIDYKITGGEILAADKNCLIVANHPSLIDYVLIASQLRQCDCLVKASIWQNPFMKYVVQGAGYIPNKSPDDLLNQCEQRFERGNVLLVFPEGTRTTPGVKSQLQRGASQIAIRTERDLRIVHITVTPSFLTKEKMWYQVPETKPFFHVEVKHKVEVKPFIEQTNNPTSAARRLNTHLAEAIFPE
ncbi:1-acyl-sn-glycerol-3-phosphate acyltransferase [Vibrio vulnificus]|uniref:1-acyl-sn-glycerol-3-phosphate acyltransferase n=5 Tax=Vibrio vulnificus TaxID=672 RepID=A0A1W6M2A1_VIBVL|nr:MULTISPECIES: lysophospholipid acyltransferase family protein [Vibrio]AAO08588.1 1-acyl-sn-glycerol-3-phosphate acyltransferase [Vibrio vulnificus CMCP6]ADV87168.1 1-acyl-sn-glycerol-3-phosphate acyltransferase [Vibrio vulnificus MO6-24/O]AIL70097.1 1-acyl-sn-glycerol-3-phosphate acyltransferase [Vibrio vulnificus]ALM71486.1 1-acyl-sn-glycerol-3-phosphate acyltransferase [Vibrio vulnificus]AMG11600.1 1-acyl-sn-glycerol-3-phosphate acyltransferase [Vibrio vulnificus]